MKIKAKKYFFCSDIRQHLPAGETAEVRDHYGTQVVRAGLAEEVKTKAKPTVEAKPQEEAKVMTSEKSLKKTKKK